MSTPLETCREIIEKFLLTCEIMFSNGVKYIYFEFSFSSGERRIITKTMAAKIGITIVNQPTDS